MARDTHIPIHEDKELNHEWWAARNITLGDMGKNNLSVYMNLIRDASGRYNGYLIILGQQFQTVRTVAEAEAALASFGYKPPGGTDPM